MVLGDAENARHECSGKAEYGKPLVVKIQVNEDSGCRRVLIAFG